MSGRRIHNLGIPDYGVSYQGPGLPRYHSQYSGGRTWQTHTASGHSLMGGAPNLTQTRFENNYYRGGGYYGGYGAPGVVGLNIGPVGVAIPVPPRLAFGLAAGTAAANLVAAATQPQYPAGYYPSAPMQGFAVPPQAPVQYVQPPVAPPGYYQSAPQLGVQPGFAVPPQAPVQTQALPPIAQAAPVAPAARTTLPADPRRSEADLYRHYNPESIAGDMPDEGRPTSQFRRSAAPRPVVPHVAARVDANSSTYTIQPNTTLSHIAQAVNGQRPVGQTVAELARINGIEDPNKIRAGATIKTAETLREFMERGAREGGLTQVSAGLHRQLSEEQSRDPQAFARRMEAAGDRVRVRDGALETRGADGRFTAVQPSGGNNPTNLLEQATQRLQTAAVEPTTPAPSRLALAEPAATRPAWLSPGSRL